MEFRDLVGKLYGENTIKESTVDSTEVQKESSLPSLKKIFESLSQQVDEAIPAGMKPLAILDPQNKSAGAGVVKSSNPAVQKMLGSLDPKDVQIVMTTQGTGTAGTTPTTQTGGTAMKEEELDEKWAGGGEGGGDGPKAKAKAQVIKAYGPGIITFRKTSNGGYFIQHEDDFGDTNSHQYDPRTGKVDFSGVTSSSYYGEGVAKGAAMKEEQLDEKYYGFEKVKKAAAKGGAKNPAAVAAAAGRKKYGKEKFQAMAAAGKRKDESLDEKAKNPYAIGMAAAKKSAGITKKHATDLPKSVVVKGHEIAKKIKKKEKMDEGMAKRGLNMFGDDYYMDIIQDLIDNNRRNMSPSRKPKVMAYVKREIEKEGGVFDPKLFDQMYKQIISFSKDIDEGDIASTKSQDTMGAGLGAGRSSVALESIQVNESMNKKHRAAYQEGQADGLRERACRVKHYEDMEEAKHYYEGWKAGLDECYGMGVKQEPITGMEEAVAAMEAGMGEGNAFTNFLATHDKGETGMLGGRKVKDTSNYDAKTEALAFESLDKQLNALLSEDAEPVAEGLSVSMSTGQQGSPDSVSVTGTDDEAGKLLSFIKQVGLGGMGGEKAAEPAVVATVSDYGAPKFAGHDNPDMKALLQKVGADEDYKDEEGHEHGEPCNECGMTEGCGCSKEPVEEVQTQDQKLYATTESDDSEDDGFDSSARNTELDNAGKPASGGATNEDGAEAPGSNVVGQEEQENAEKVAESEKLDEWANNAGQKGTDTAFEQDIEFMTKVISGGLNKPKVTGQTTIPVIAHQDARDGTPEDLGSWVKLAGLKPSVKK